MGAPRGMERLAGVCVLCECVLCVCVMGFSGVKGLKHSLDDGNGKPKSNAVEGSGEEQKVRGRRDGAQERGTWHTHTHILTQHHIHTHTHMQRHTHTHTHTHTHNTYTHNLRAMGA